LDPGSEIRDPGSGMGKNQDLGSGINIPDPQHWAACQQTFEIGRSRPKYVMRHAFQRLLQFLCLLKM
jgi:hypothetical protein